MCEACGDADVRREGNDDAHTEAVRRFLDEWPAPLDVLAQERAVMPVSPTPEQLAEGVWCGGCGGMVPVTDEGCMTNVCWFVAWHGPAANPCPGSGLPCDGERPE